MASKGPGYVLDKLKFYKEIAESGIEYTPPPQFFKDAEDVIQDLLQQVNNLKTTQQERS